MPSLSIMVEQATPAHINARIQHESELLTKYLQDDRGRLDQRLARLDNEWDVERFIMTEAPLMTALGLLLGATVDRRWLLAPLAIQGLVFIHAQTGCYPWLPILRRLGFRTQREIESERERLLEMQHTAQSG